MKGIPASIGQRRARTGPRCADPDRRPGPRFQFPEVQPERRGDGGRDLALAQFRRIMQLSARDLPGPGHCQPDVLRALHADTVVHPVAQRAAAPVVGGHDQQSVGAVVRLRLQPGPQLAQEAVGQRHAVEHVGVAAGMRPFVGIAQADVQQARALALEVAQGEGRGERVEALLAPGARLALDRAEPGDAGIVVLERHEAGVDGDAAGHALGDLREAVPGTERGHLGLRQAQSCAHELQHGGVRVLDGIVAGHGGIARQAGEHLRVAGIGEAQGVVHLYPAAERGVAGDPAVFVHQRAPEERHQLLAPGLRGRRLVPAERRGAVGRRLVRGEADAHRVRVQAAEHLRKAHAVERDQHDVGRRVRGVRLRARPGRAGNRQQRDERAEQRPQHASSLPDAVRVWRCANLDVIPAVFNRRCWNLIPESMDQRRRERHPCESRSRFHGLEKQKTLDSCFRRNDEQGNGRLRPFGAFRAWPPSRGDERESTCGSHTRSHACAFDRASASEAQRHAEVE